MMITGRSSCVLANTPGRWPLLPPRKEAGAESYKAAWLPMASTPRSEDPALRLSLVPREQEKASHVERTLSGL